MKTMKKEKKGIGLSDYTRRLVLALQEADRDRTARAYATACRMLLKFAGVEELRMNEITAGLLHGFERDMCEKGRMPNTVSFYMRNLRAVYNKAVREGLAEERPNLFEGVYTGVQVTRKRALTKEEMAEMAAVAETAETPRLTRATLIFLFCFYARGMSFVDLAFLRKTDIRNGVLLYRRKKTGRMLEMKVTAGMQRILRRFEKETEGSPYLFPLIQPGCGPERRQYESALRLQNLHLKKLAAYCNILKPLSTHAARHTWATLAREARLPLAVISEGLGHTSEKTTTIYLKAFDRGVLDRANNRVAGLIRKAV